VKDKLSKLLPGTQWVTNSSLVELNRLARSSFMASYGVDMPALWKPGYAAGQNAIKRIPKGAVVTVVDRKTYNLGSQGPAQAPVIEYEGAQYIVLDDAPSLFTSVDAPAGLSDVSMNDMISYVLVTLGPSDANTILDKVGELKGMGHVSHSSQYLQQAVKQGMVTVASKNGRTPIYQATGKGAARANIVREKLGL